MQLFFDQLMNGIGAGAVYGTCVGNALKWFPDRRGLAAGLTAAGGRIVIISFMSLEDRKVKETFRNLSAKANILWAAGKKEEALTVADSFYTG